MSLNNSQTFERILRVLKEIVGCLGFPLVDTSHSCNHAGGCILLDGTKLGCIMGIDGIVLLESPQIVIHRDIREKPVTIVFKDERYGYCGGGAKCPRFLEFAIFNGFVAGARPYFDLLQPPSPPIKIDVKNN